MNPLDQAQDNINNCFQQLVADNDHAQLPENYFKNYFLPRFIAGDKTVISEWISISGSPTAPVNIIDHMSKVLFSVPPLFNSLATDGLLKSDGLTIPEIIDGHNLRSANISAQATAFSNHHLSNTANFLTQYLTENGEGQNQWRDILTRYGVELPGTINTTTSVISDNSGYDYE